MDGIRRGGEADVEAIEPLWHELHAFDRNTAEVPLQADDAVSWEVRSRFYVEHLRSGSGVLFLAGEEGRVVGYAFGLLNAAPDDTWAFRVGWTELYSLAVTGAARGRGLGGRLVDAVTADARERGFDGLTVATMTANADAIGFYQRHGFVPAEIVLLRMEAGSEH